MSESLDHQEFRLNMRRAKRKGEPWATVETYEPRAYDPRPAVRVDDIVELQAVIRATPVRLDWDTLGDGWIVYPAERAPREVASLLGGNLTIEEV